jgi:hypothetical protein
MTTEVPGSPEVQARINATRAELDSTLGTIEDKLNVPKQFNRVSTQAKAVYEVRREQAMASYRDKPVPWIVAATAVGIVVVGAIAWAIFSDD